MKLLFRFFLLIFILFLSGKSFAQTTHFNEDFNNGQTQGFLANGYNGWTVTTPGLNGLYANEWFITCSENGNPTGTCGSGCGNDATLHIGSISGSPSSIFCPFGDCGAAYDAGFFTGEVVTDKRAESPTINLTCSGNPVTISFKYIENGQGAIDNFTLDYFDGISWTQIDDPAKTLNNCAGQGRWTFYSFALPASAVGNPNVKVGFHWVNNDDATGNDPSVALDSIRVTSPATAPTLNADFLISNSNPCLNDCINFTDQSTGNITSWSWDFGGGGNPLTSNIQSPTSVCWNSSGSYNVTLIITDNCGNTASQIQQVDVTNCNGLIANFSASDTTICEGTCIDFTDLSTPVGGIISWSWLFVGAANPNSNLQNPTGICYPTAGSYIVKLSVSDGITSSTLVLNSYIIVSNCIAPTANFSASATNGCLNDCITFTDQSQNATTWGWGFPGGTPSFFIGQNPPQICYAVAGSYDVVQYVADANGNTDTLIQTSYITINNCTFPVANFSASSTNGCLNDCITFTDQSQNTATWGWGFPGGAPNFYIGQNPPQICYSVAGTYDVAQYVADASGNTDTLIQVGYITIVNCSPPVAAFSSTVTNGCTNDCFTFTETSSNATSWSWNFSGGSPAVFSGQTPPLVCYSTPGVYDVLLVVSNAYGVDSLNLVNYISINYCALTSIFAASDSFICAGECISFVDLSFGNPIGWVWSFPGGSPDTVTAQNPPYVCYQNAGVYPVTLVVFDSIGVDTVTYTDFITVVEGTPVSTNIDSTTIFAGTQIQLIATGGISYAWNNGNSLDADSIPNPIATPYDTTNYTVTMYDMNGCSSIKSILINVIPPETVWAPNAFTPNNDKNNDIFYLRPGGIIINYELRIFDRWGEMLFESKDPTAGWDGTYLNTRLNVGVYVYYYKIEFIDGAILENSGDVTLLR